jgi:hypothetical protein
MKETKNEYQISVGGTNPLQSGQFEYREGNRRLILAFILGKKTE